MKFLFMFVIGIRLIDNEFTLLYFRKIIMKAYISINAYILHIMLYNNSIMDNKGRK